jgi:hypothetical protein
MTKEKQSWQDKPKPLSEQTEPKQPGGTAARHEDGAPIGR